MSIFSCFSPSSSTAGADCCGACGISCPMSRRSLSSLPARFMSSVFRFSSMVFPPSCPSSKDMPPEGKKELLSHSQKTALRILCQKGGLSNGAFYRYRHFVKIIPHRKRHRHCHTGHRHLSCGGFYHTYRPYHRFSGFHQRTDNTLRR